MTSTRALIGLVAATTLLHGCARDSINAPRIDPAAVASVSVTPAPPPSLHVGATFGLTAIVRNSRDSVLTTPVTWSSSNVAVAAVPAGDTSNQSTVVTALSPGSATITATSQTKSASVTIVVRTPGPVATVEVTPATQVLSLGGSYQLAVVLRDSDHVVLTGHDVAFASSAPTIAGVSITGLVTAVASGSATLTATSEGKAGSAAVNVEPPPAPSRAFLWTAADGLKDLGLLPGFTEAQATAIDATGEVAGTLYNGATSTVHAFTWTSTGGMQDLGTLPGSSYSTAAGMNGSGQVVGSANTSAGYAHAVLWTATGAIQDLGTLPGDYVSYAYAINDAGAVVGESDDSSRTTRRGFIWTQAGGMSPLVAEAGSAYGYGINSLAQVAGVTGVNGSQAFRWSQQLGLKVLPIVTGDDSGIAWGINDGGDVVGVSYPNCPYVGCPPPHAVLWPAAGGVINLSAQPGFTGDASAVAINSAGQIVGSVGGRAFLWSSAGGLKDLGVLPGRAYSTATAINAVGQVVGSSFSP